MQIGIVSHMFPTRRRPMFGVFVKEELDRLAEFTDIRLFAPYPNRYWLTRDKDNQYLPYPAERPFVFAYSRFFLQHRFPVSMANAIRSAEKRGLFEGCGLIHAHSAFPDAVAAAEVFGGRLPVIVTVHGSDVNMFAMKRSLQPDIVRSLNAAERIIAVSGSLAAKLRDIGVTTPIKVIPNGIDTGLFRPGDRTVSCHALGLDPGRPRLLFAGNFVPVKGVKYLIRAMPAILDKYPDCELVLLGARQGTADRHAYDADIREAGIGHAVRVQESVPHDHLPVWMNAADMLVLPSIHEGFGLVAAEALACGKPVVATRSGGPEDIVRAGQGMLVPSKDPGALSEAVMLAFEGTDIAAPNAIVGDAAKRFSFGMVANAIMNVYKDVIEKR